jgi:integrase
MKKRLTDLAIARMAPPAEGRIDCWDELLPSLGIRLSATGRKVWNIARRKQGGRNPIRHRLGTFPELSVAEARAKARELIAGGQQPRINTKFSDIAEQFLQHARTRKGRPLRPATIKSYRIVLLNYARPLHRTPFAELRRHDVAELVRNISTSSGAPTASLVRAVLGRLWAYAIEVGATEANVVAGSASYDVPARSRVLSDSELAALWRATDGKTDFNMAVRLMLWTGCRRSEAGGATWSEFMDVLWRLPPTRTKNGRALDLPLPRQAVAALAKWPHRFGRQHLFGTSSSRGYLGMDRAKELLDKRLNFSRHWVLHDIRRSVESRLAALGVSKEVRARLLNHDVSKVDVVYQRHDFLAEKRQALQAWADALEAITSQAAPTVLRLKQV